MKKPIQERFRFKNLQGTTIIAIEHKGKAAMGGDGQVSLGNTIMKQNATKVRKLYNGEVLSGFAGAAADAFALFSRFESRLQEYRGNLQRAAVELAKDWRTDKVLRRLEALLIVMDKKNLYLISGTGDIIEPDDGVIGIGSGGPYAVAASRALMKYSTLDIKEIVEESLKIAASICIYTNENITVEVLE